MILFLLVYSSFKGLGLGVQGLRILGLGGFLQGFKLILRGIRRDP